MSHRRSSLALLPFVLLSLAVLAPIATAQEPVPPSPSQPPSGGDAPPEADPPAEPPPEQDQTGSDEQPAPGADEGDDADGDDADGGADDARAVPPAEPTEEPPEDAPFSFDEMDEEMLAEEEAAEAGTAEDPADPGAQPEQDPDDENSGNGRDDDQDADWADGPALAEVTAAVIVPEDVFRTGGAIGLLTEEQLEVFDDDDPNTALLQLPGVYVRAEDGFGLRPNIGLRGASSDRSKKITLLEDGVLFAPAPYAAPAAYYFPIFARIAGIELYKGPAAVLYGPNTIGGAINFLTREIPREPAGRLELSYGRFQYRRAHFHFGASNERFGILFEGIHLGTTGFKELDEGDPDTGFRRSEFMLRAFAQTSPTRSGVFQRFELKLGFSRERSNETYLGITDADFAQNPYRRYAASQLDRMTWWRTQVQVRHRMVLTDHVELVTTAYRHDFQRTWRRLNRFVGERLGFAQVPTLFDTLSSPDETRQRAYYEVLTGAANSADVSVRDDDANLLVVSNGRDFVSQGIQTRLRADFRTGEAEHEIELGLRMHRDRVDRLHVEREYAMTESNLVDTGDEPVTITHNRGQATAFAGYLAYSMAYRWLTVKPGLRLETIETELRNRSAGTYDRERYTVVLPGLGATFQPAESVALVVGVHRGFSPLAPGASSDVDVETSVNYEFGARLRHLDEEGQQVASAEAIGFVNDYQNFVTQCTGSGGGGCELDEQFNAGDVLVGGVELAANYTWAATPQINVPMRVSYTFTRATFRTDFTSQDPQLGNVDRGDSVPYVPEHQWSMDIGVGTAEWGVTARGTYVGAMQESASDETLPETDDYLVVDLVGHLQVFDRFDLSLRLQNITNAQPVVARRPFGARPYRPFMVQAGIEVEL